MRIRLRGPNGAATVSLDEKASIADLISQIVEKTAVQDFDVKYGYPPKPLNLDDIEHNITLGKLHINLDGEQLTISPKDTGRKELISEAVKADDKEVSQATGSSDTGRKGGIDTTTVSSPIPLQKKSMEGEVPELPLPDRGATLG